MNLHQFRSVAEFRQTAEALARQGQASESLQMIVDLVKFTISQERSIAKVFGSAELDRLCQSVGETGSFPAEEFDEGHAVFIATALYRRGGHTKVLHDFMRADPGTRKTVLLTGVDQRLKQRKIEQILAGSQCDVKISPDLPLMERVRWLQDELRELRASRVYLFQHPFDAVAIAAVQPLLMKRLIYFHHNDHSLALGLHLDHALHVDFNLKGFYNCRENEGLSSNVVWPLVADPPVRKQDPSFLTREGLTTCTSGGAEKFDQSHLNGAVPYRIRYADVVPVILEASGGKHIHIGPMDDQLMNKIHQNLRSAGIDTGRFVPIHRVDNLAQALVDYAVDLYITSFPWSGGRAAVEAMAAGIPIAAHSNYRSVFFTDENEVYPGALRWREPHELAAHIRALNIEQLQKHSMESRDFYDRYCHPRLLASAISRTLEGTLDEPAGRPIHRPDHLQNFMDEQLSCTSCNAGTPKRTRRSLMSKLRTALKSMARPDL